MKRRTISDRVFDNIVLVIAVAVTLIVLYPLYFTVIASLSDPYQVLRGKVLLWVKGFTLEPYTNVFINSDIWYGYMNSIINTTLVTFYNLVLTIPCAYVMARRGVRGKNLLMTFFIITMYFDGGMIPWYLVVKDLGLTNTRWALIVPAGMSVFNMIIARTYFQTNMSEELYDAAKIDGCSEFAVFFKIVVPLSGAIIAVIALFVAVGNWNSYFTALLFINDKKLYPLQYVLRQILLMNQQMNIIRTNTMSTEMMQALMRRQYMAEGMKYSLIFVSSVPMLIAYPFVQKYFVKGVMIGSLKG
jgi:putative aldouronate transport system permease protein